MNKIITWVIGIVAVVALVISISTLVGNNQSAVPQDTLGASGTRFPNGISANTTSPVAGEVRATNLRLSTTNTASSTAALGCIQTTATSTASPIVLAFTSSFTSTTTFPTGTNVDGASGGLVAWNFGTCPL
jgi:hypothetical protein